MRSSLDPFVGIIKTKAVFQTRVWDLLREMVMEQLGTVRWRELLLTVLDEGDDMGTGRSVMPLQGLVNEAAFILGINRVELLKQMGKRMVEKMSMDFQPAMRTCSEEDGSFMGWDRTIFADLGIIDSMAEAGKGPLQVGPIHVRTVVLFSDSSAFHIAAFEAMAGAFGRTLRVDVAAHASSMVDHNEFRLLY